MITLDVRGSIRLFLRPLFVTGASSVITNNLSVPKDYNVEAKTPIFSIIIVAGHNRCNMSKFIKQILDIN